MTEWANPMGTDGFEFIEYAPRSASTSTPTAARASSTWPSTGDIYATVEYLRARGVAFMDVPDTYYEAVGRPRARPRRGPRAPAAQPHLIDGAPTQGGGLLLQIFTTTVIGPIFFEIIQRKGNEGFGEGNFRALFESIERDQIARGVLKG